MTALQDQGLWVPAIVLAGLLLSVSMESLARPKSAGLRRGLAYLALHAGLWFVAWACCLAVLARPVFAALAVLAGQYLVIGVSNAKYRALREPFIFSDFGIFSQAIKHPRLYFPFLGMGQALLIFLSIAGAAGIGLWLEHPMKSPAFWSFWAALVGIVLLVAGMLLAQAPSLDPQRDLAERGLFASIAQYWLREKTIKPVRTTKLGVSLARNREFPDIVVIQSESFFDARRLFPGIKQGVLSGYDEACRASTQHGQLSVPAWGANTMRPEFSFLSGLDPASLDIHRFNPYRRVARRPIHALPAVLREAGYSTTCIHPHPARFFRRDRAFPSMGFTRFVDIRRFRGARKSGPYIGDEAVTDKIIHELGTATQPTFLFVITMENHGPLHLEKLEPGDLEDFYTTPPPSGCDDLTIYLRHLRNADRQLQRLREHLDSRRRPTLLCFYGEHLPSMPRVFENFGMPDGRTDYFLAFPDQSRPPVRRDLKIAELPHEILRSLA